MLLWLVICGALAFSGLMLTTFSDDDASMGIGLLMALVFGYLFTVEWIQQENLRDQPREDCVADGGTWMKEIRVKDPGGQVIVVHSGACVYGHEPVEDLDA